jgi:hypothetical protein
MKSNLVLEGRNLWKISYQDGVLISKVIKTKIPTAEEIVETCEIEEKIIYFD